MYRKPGILILIAMSAALVFGAATPAAGHGTIDQALTGNPACTVGNFAGSVSGGAAISRRQEFVPAEPGLLAVDLCMNFVSVASVTVNIRSGTAAAPGPILATRSRQAAASGFQWFHFDLPELEQVTVGQKYVIEVPGLGNNVEWRAKCGEIVGNCLAIDPDAYPPGVSTRTNGSDFGFRTLSAPVLIEPIGDADQSLVGDPDCGPTVFRHAAVGVGRQEFVPSETGLSAVDLCLNVLNPGLAVSVSIRRGDVATPGTLVQTDSRTPSAAGYQWVRVVFDPVVATTPGTKYLIEVPAGGANYQWRGKCGAVAGACTTLDINTYLAGVSNQAGGADLSFRTIKGIPGGAPAGVADQKLTGDPVCSEDNFEGTVTSATPHQQEFVPTAGTRGLDAIDICVNVLDSGTTIQLRLRSGTIAAPGPIIVTLSRTINVEGYQFVRFDLPNVLPMKGGFGHIIEVQQNAGFQWRGTCAQVSGSCSAIDPDSYPLGKSNRPLIRDFGFRTIAGIPATAVLPMIVRDGF